MASENLIPSYLAEIYNRAIPDPVSDNSPFQGFSAPVDNLTVKNTVSTAAGAGPFHYGAAHYAAATYGNH